ncbi:uncharacterized protein LOC105691582 [Athalia rosae]|uniref:uncharacterized protein LOC105691582 n=1 Tax=Athalia rosae TaxID=37344 RepID=UPI0020341ECE|nr:uncharacterized protein LOC105691582 [Athalia rosae]XP_048507947.1 uncharacterized protein LOC105691582 [Athalia rosae]
MDLEGFGKNSVKILGLLFVITTVLTATHSQDEIIKLYTSEDDTYDEEYASINGGEDDKNLREGASEPVGERSAHPTTKCDENQLMAFLAELQVINPESLLLIASYKDLENLCRRIAGNLDSIDSFIQTCVPLPQDHLYMQLIAGLRILSTKLCVESNYQKSYRNYLTCFHELHAEYTDCAGPADWTENMDRSELCKEYKLISDCYYTKTAMLCGIKAAEIMKELVVEVVDRIIDAKCPNLQNNPVVLNAMSEKASSYASLPKCFGRNLSLTIFTITTVVTLLLS